LGEPAEQNFGLAKADDPYPYRLTSEAKRENMRGWLAAALFWLLALTLLGSFVLQWVHPERNKDWLNMVLSPLVALVGAATGFYFGANSTKKD